MTDQQPEKPEETDTAEPVTAGERRSGGGGLWAVVLALIAVLAAGGGLFAGYVYWTQAQASLRRLDVAVERAGANQAQLASGLDAIRSEFQRQRDDLQAQKQGLEDAQAQLDQRAADMRAALNGVYQRLGRSTEDWKAAEAEYLLVVANHRLRLMRDRDTAIAALQAADDRLRDSGDPGWISVREAIASELAALRAVDLPDRAGLSARIDGLAEQVDGLKLRGAVPSARPRSTAPQPAQAPIAPGKEGPVESLLRDGLAGLKSVLEIRRRDQPVVAMLAPEQQYFVFQNLRLQLQAARLAALQADPVLYRSSLETAQSWLHDLFDPRDPATQSFAAALAELQKIERQTRPAGYLGVPQAAS